MAKSVWISGRPIAVDNDFKQWASGRPFIYRLPTARIIPTNAKKTQSAPGKSTLDAYRKKTKKGELRRWQS